MSNMLHTILKELLKIQNFDREIEILLSETILPGVWEYSSSRFTKPQASTVLKSWRRISQVDAYSFGSVQMFLSFDFYGFNIVFEDKSLASPHF